LGYRVEWLEETEAELKVFSKDFRRTIKRKVETIASSIPISLKLRSVQPVKRQEELDVTGRLYELDISSGSRVVFVVYEDRQLMIVYMVGTHDYAYANYLTLAAERLGPLSSTPPSSPTPDKP